MEGSELSPLGVHHPDITAGAADFLWPLNSYSVKLENTRIIKSGRGKLYGFTVWNSNASAQFVLLFDHEGVPPSTALPVSVYPVAGASTLFIGYADVGRSFNQGIVLANSSTGASFTVGSADCWFDAQYL